MKYSIPGLGGRLRIARNTTGLSQEAVATELGISWMTVHRWERSQRGVPDHLLDKVCVLYNRPLKWFLTLEDDDLAAMAENVSNAPTARGASTEAAERIRRLVADAPAEHRPMIEKVVDDILDGVSAG
jgi:transcriptional regulator with XRE-family HTH domain